MGKKNNRKSFILNSVLILAVMYLSACNAAVVSSNTDQNSAAAQIEEKSTPSIEYSFDINNWDEVSLSQDLSLRNLGEGVIEVIHRFPWAANSLLVQMPDGTFVWAGSTYTPEAASLVLRWLDQYYNDYKMVGIDTGYHVDNLGGSAALIERGYPVYGSDLTVDLLAEKGEEMRAYMIELSQESGQSFYADYHKNISYLAPTHIFPVDDGLHLEFGGETVIVFYPGPTQTEDKLVVYFPEKKILFGSCMVLGGDEVGNTREAYVSSWIQAMTKLKEWDADVIIPGHGDRLGSDLLDHTIRLLENYQTDEK